MNEAVVPSAAEPAPCATLTDVLDLRARTIPDKIAYRFLRDGELETESISFGALRERALAIAAQLVALGACGERAVLVYPQGLAFLSAFWGCLYASVVAVPASVPNKKRGIDIVRRVAADAQARFLLSTGPLLEALASDARERAGLTNLSCFDTESGAANVDVAALPQLEPTDLALLQYTSGSTGLPRGVMVTHENLVENHRHVAACLGSDADTKYVSWLPMFHDMGLGIALQAVWVGVETILMPPRAFVHDPLRWLAAIARYRATTSGGPDFAFDLCVRRVSEQDRQALDLSCWRTAYNGSEPVDVATLQRFAAAFASTGFREAAFQPVYGLAEATLLASSEQPEDPLVVRVFDQQALARGEATPATGEGGRALVSLGRPWPGTSLAIVDPVTREECVPGRIGEVWLQGKSVARGYFGRETETRATFAASTARGRGSFLRTGDLGFVAGGRLFVTGRRRDVIVLGRRTYYPQEMEATASRSHPALTPYGAAAFTPGHGDGLVIAQEVSRSALRGLDAERVMSDLCAAVARAHGVEVRAVDLLMPGTLPRTTSGKVRRGACRAAFRDHAFSVLASFRIAAAPPPQVLHPIESVEPPATAGPASRLCDWLRANAAELIANHELAQPGPRMGPLLRDLAKVGLVGMQVEHAYGGLGLGVLEGTRVVEQLAAVHFKVAVALAVNEYLGILPIARHASATLRSWLLPGLVHAEEVAAFADADHATAARPVAGALRIPGDVGGICRLSGAKLFDSILVAPTVANVFVAERDGERSSAFVVAGRDLHASALPEVAAETELGFARGTLNLDGLLVGAEQSLGEPGRGAEIAAEALMHFRLGTAAACVGGMKRCAQLAVRSGPYRTAGLASKRTPNPVTLSRLGAVKARVTALSCLVERVARALDAGQRVAPEAFAVCQLLGPELLLRSIEDVLQLGFALEPADRERIFALHRDAGLLQNHAGSPEVIAEATGARVMEDNPALATLLADVFDAPRLDDEFERIEETIRYRMTKLNPALAQRAQRWANTRAGELAGWVLLLAALEGSARAAPSPELEHARAWAEAQFEFALAAVRFGTPSDTAAIDSADAAATFAAYARAIGDAGA